jgi:RES domain
VPRASEVDPLIETLPAGTLLVRVHPTARGPLSFNPTPAAGRFRPVRAPSRAVVPTAYFGADEETALAEAVLRGVTALERHARPRRLYRIEITGLAISPVRLTRATRVARMHGAGLTRLGLLRRHVIDCEASDYPYTAAWAQTLWGCRRRPAGISWTSHQSDSSRAYMLWQPRIAREGLLVAGAELPIDREPGLDLVRQACVAAGVEFEG